MTTPSLSPKEVTHLLLDWSRGDQSALDKLMPLVYGELRRMANRYMRRERVGHTLQATALINEAYLRLVDQQNVQWQNRAHFFAISAQLMRRILVDHARSHTRAKRGGGVLRVSLNEALVPSQERAAELVALDEALKRLATIDLRKSQVVELRFFGGLSVEETAEVLKVTPMTVTRDWKTAKAWLHREIGNES
jgi:RNA polymerase sigma-70 factor (ECF subfamily)